MVTIGGEMKNWTVVVKQIKKQKIGFINHTNYLLNPNADSHKNTIIRPIGDVQKAIDNTLQEVENRKLLRKNRGSEEEQYKTFPPLSFWLSPLKSKPLRRNGQK